ncbi:hypothetical protein HTV80_27185 [Streptomyces sp. Vc74B-19]|uniref:hypothetical protein n=1 Tax=unclassified Streptomyces TaxID=2593676 RepID=UPI001BFC463F|nr:MULTISPECIES: hypothetical protein [unclassified Streptomyces]MBT3166756.1 hypothetical protein [Streptomyces sp. Vc74B-19]MDU0302998.1 hypothetical protein [Streptomyces sp. PAL114]
MFQPTPVYDRLVAERGDIPVQVRGEADRIHRDLAEVLPQLPSTPPAYDTAEAPPGPAAPQRHP